MRRIPQKLLPHLEPHAEHIVHHAYFLQHLQQHIAHHSANFRPVLQTPSPMFARLTGISKMTTRNMMPVQPDCPAVTLPIIQNVQLDVRMDKLQATNRLAYQYGLYADIEKGQVRWKTRQGATNTRHDEVAQKQVHAIVESAWEYGYRKMEMLGE